MVWMRQYFVDEVLSWITGVDSSQIYRYNYASLVVFSSVMKQFICVPKLREIRDTHGVSWRGIQINVIGDGVEQHVSSCSTTLTEKSLYSGKKCRHTFTKLASDLLPV